LLDGQILLPWYPVLCVVAGAGSIQSQETRQSVDSQLKAEELERVPFKLFVCHRIEAVHRKFSLLNFRRLRAGQVQHVVGPITSGLQTRGAIGNWIIYF
jgi:hypothetical protein